MSISMTTALLLLMVLAAFPAHPSLLPVTQELFGTQAHGVVAAFGDFNADKQTDMFVVRERSKLMIFLADQKAPYFKPKVELHLEETIEITSVVPGDYNGDSQMDVLLTTAPENQAKSDIRLSAVIFWGHNQTLNIINKTDLNETYSDEPLIMDYNGDLIPDIFYITRESKQPHILLGGILKLNYTLPSQNEMFVPHSHAFIDLNSDFSADLFLTTRSGTDIQFETWINMNGNYFNCTRLVQKPRNALIIGQSVFADFDGDGRQDHLVPTCEDERCLKSAIYLRKPDSSEWTNILPDLNSKDTLWGFVAGENTPPITLHIGDYNMDGFPDALAILKNTSGSNQQAFLLENVACHNASCKNVGRMFNVYWEPSELSQIKDAAVATFFDIYEDGILDIIVLSKGPQSNDFAISAFKNNFEADAYFVKVIVLSGLCSNDCPDHAKPFGVNQPGPYIMYTTVDSNGISKNASAGQLSQSAHSALQLPYNVLGLGRSANFLDHLIVGIPRAKGDSDTRSQEWTAIIPNSQLIVIPYQPDVPRSWSAKLYLTPSNSVMLTAIALIGVCVFILTIIGILHWQEKKADDREKRQEAHRFHFDAM